MKCIQITKIKDFEKKEIDLQAPGNEEVLIKVHVGRMYSLGEVNFIQGIHDLGNCKNSVGLKPIAVRLSSTA